MAVSFVLYKVFKPEPLTGVSLHKPNQGLYENLILKYMYIPNPLILWI